jgi:hypothetical protein
MHSYLSPQFFIGSIHIKSVEGASCVNLGNNLPTHFQNYQKQNQGFGTISGDYSRIMGTKSEIEDGGNFMDLFHPSHSDEIPDWLKKTMQNIAAQAQNQTEDEYC